MVMQAKVKRKRVVGNVKSRNGKFHINVSVDKDTYKKITEIQLARGLSTQQELIRVLIKKCIATS